ncbi:MAG: DUF4386 domain-containing protein [Brevinematales bacterium]|nr:DUF4386 domain-containing protein [Brevinematales bacterium]
MSVNFQESFPDIAEWKGIFKFAIFAAIYMIAVIPVQAVIFMVSPPPQTVIDFFTLFQQNRLLGLLDLDLLLTIDYLLIIPMYIAIYVVLRRDEKSWSTLALILGIVSIVLYIVSREATFTMMSLSDQYFAAATDAQKNALLAAGQTLLAIYNGSTFDISYILGATTTLIISILMLRSRFFRKPVAVTGIITASMMFIPPTAGTIGIWVSMLSLIPTIVWLVFMARDFVRLNKSASRKV